jgi:branched-chain amino acid transport system ATP-binding protein
MSDPVLDVSDLVVAYGPMTGLRDVSLSACAGEIVCVVGANGAGKSTLLKAVAGFLPARHGSVVVNGEDLRRYSVERRVRAGIALVPEGRQIWAELTVHEHLRLGCYGNRPSKRVFAERLERVYELFPRLAERRKQTGGTLSGGEQQMLAIGRALMSQPTLLLLDEPTLGLAPIVIDTLVDTLRATGSSELAVLVAEQNAEFAFDVADRGYVLEVGGCVLSGTADELRSRSDLDSAYLGERDGPDIVARNSAVHSAPEM